MFLVLFSVSRKQSFLYGLTLHTRPHSPHEASLSTRGLTLHTRPHSPHEASLSTRGLTLHTRPPSPYETSPSTWGLTLYSRPPSPYETSPSTQIKQEDHSKWQPLSTIYCVSFLSLFMLKWNVTVDSTTACHWSCIQILQPVFDNHKITSLPFCPLKHRFQTLICQSPGFMQIFYAASIYSGSRQNMRLTAKFWLTCAVMVPRK